MIIRLYVGSDGSIKNGIGGVGFVIEYHCELNGPKHIIKHHLYYELQNKYNKEHLQYIHCNKKCCLNNNPGSVFDLNCCILNI